MKNAAVVLALLLFCTAPVQDAWAKSNLGLNRLGVDVGMVDPEAVGGTLGLGASADWGTLSKRVHLSSHLGYWSKSEDYGFGSEASIRDVSFTTRVTYHFRVSSPKFQPYAGGGLGLHFYNMEVAIPDFGGGSITASDSRRSWIRHRRRRAGCRSVRRRTCTARCGTRLPTSTSSRSRSACRSSSRSRRPQDANDERARP